MSLLADHNLPFAVAFAAMLVLALVQVIGLGGHHADIDVDLDADAGLGDALTTLLGIGRVPFMIWLVLFLFLFAALGVSIQSLAEGLAGAPLSPLLAAAITLVAALPVTGALVRPLARIMPKDETTAVPLDALVGCRATITTGRASAGNPARARVLDGHGQMHHVMVEPHEPGSEMREGDELLLVRREGERFFGVALAERRLAPLD
jgi:Protein of unknown function (DUF1449)